MDLNLTYDVAGIIISVILFYYFGTTKKSTAVQNKIFGYLIAANIFSAIFDVADMVLDIFNAPLIIRNIANVITGLFYAIIPTLLLFYILLGVKRYSEFSKVQKCLFIAPIIISSLLIVTNPFTHFVTYFDVSGGTERHIGFVIVSFISLYYLVMVIFAVFHYGMAFNSVKKITYTVVTIIILSALVWQIYDCNAHVEIFALSYVFLIMFFVIQNPHDQVDPETGVYNRNSFLSVMEQNIIFKRDCNIIILVLQDFDDLDRNVATEDSTSMAVQITEYLSGIGKDINVYRYDKNVFCLEIFKYNSKATDILLKKIDDRFKKYWKYGEYEIIYTYKLCKMNIIEDSLSVNSIVSIINGCISSHTDKEIINVQDFDLAEFERKVKMNAAVQKAIENDTITLSYSPIYKFDSKSIYSLQISSQFLDDEIGLVDESEFRPIVEKLGKTTEVGCKLFSKLCEFIVDEKLENYGIYSYAITLSSIMCIQSGFVDYMTEYLESMGIKPERIVFLISEYTVSRCEDTIREIMPILQERGYRFCLDNYGKGFTNLASVYDLNFDVLKIDRSVTNNAFNDMKAAITLKSTILLAQRLNMKTMVSGIYDKEFLDFVSDLQCTYVSGKYFMEDIGRKEIVDILKVQSENIMSTKSDENLFKGDVV